MYWGKADHARAFAMLDQVEHGMRAYAKELLDEYHGEHRSQRYYDILVGYWLQWLAHSVVFGSGTCCDPDKFRGSMSSLPVFAVELDMISYVLAHGDFHELTRCLAELQAGEPLAFAADKAVFAAGPAGSGMRRLIRRWLARIGSSEAVLVCAPYAKCSLPEWLRFVLRARKLMRWDDLLAHPGFEVAIDSEWRLAKFRAVRAESGDLLGAIKRLMPLFIPAVYLEGLGSLRRIAGQMRIGRPKAFYTANALYLHPLFKVLAAEHEQSTLLLGHQHGGSFGMELRHAPEEYERSVCDFFYTWGWGESCEDTRVLTPPAFSRRRRKRWQLLLCLGDFPQTPYRVQFFPAGAAAERTIRDTLEFANGLAERHGQGMLIRPPGEQYGRGWIEALRQTLPAAHVDPGGQRAITRFAESELVFHNYLSTGWLESIWLQVPTLAIYDPDVYAFRDELRPHLAAFERFGLLHRSGSSAAQHYARIRDDVQGWWRQAEFQAARNDFAARYVRVRADWQREWVREFSWLLENREAIIGKRSRQTGSPPRVTRECADSIV